MDVWVRRAELGDETKAKAKAKHYTEDTKKHRGHGGAVPRNEGRALATIPAQGPNVRVLLLATRNARQKQNINAEDAEKSGGTET